MADVIFECPKCKQRLEAPPDMMGQPIACPSCKNSLRIPYSKKSLQSIGPLRRSSPTSDYCDSRYKSLINAISMATQTAEEHIKCIEKYRAHSKQHYCFQCKLWVDPHFDYEQVSSGGGGFVMDNGMVVVRQNNSTREFVRCSHCGKRLIESSGAEWAERETKEYKSISRRLQRLHRRKQKWEEINHVEKTRPGLASALRFLWVFPWIMPSLISLLLIGAAILLQQHLAAVAYLKRADAAYQRAINTTGSYDRFLNLQNFVSKYPNSPQVKQATIFLAEASYERAINTTDPYDRLYNFRNFVSSYPDSPHAEQAMALLTALENDLRRNE